MTTSTSRALIIFVAFANFSYKAAFADGCGPPPMVNPHECCDASFAEKSTLDECGVDNIELLMQDKPISCDKHACVFKKLTIMQDDETIDLPAATAFFTKWVEKNPEWAGVTEELGKECLSDRVFEHGPPVCHPLKLAFCVTRVFIQSCPAGKWKDSTECSELKKYMGECHNTHP